MISRSIVLLASLALVACVARKHSPATDRADSQATVADSVGPTHAQLDLSGSWATGSAGEPEARRVELHLQCNYTPPLWILEQTGDTVSAFLNPESRAQGVLSPEPPPRIPAKGLLRGVDLTLEMPGTRYVLHYDSTSGHLRGTFNGAPFWAVRQDIVHATGCIPPP
ncbi:MAG TPA: hypothetical protein VJ865_06985 [Gemmatimonadaceae bacterium]|nr:hypothetical protein [Gemmatimonadaceae bacterium]